MITETAVSHWVWIKNKGRRDCSNLLTFYSKYLRTDDVLALTSQTANQSAYIFLHLCTLKLITGRSCCSPKPCQNSSEQRPGRWAVIRLNTYSCVPLQKQTTTIILISALFKPLQQSSRPSSEDTWASLFHHRDYSKHIVPIVWRSPFSFAQWQQY